MICVSIVSHGHGSMVSRLIEQILACPQVTQLIVTLNIPEDFSFVSDSRLLVIFNDSPKGFGANHNAAFDVCNEPFFCVLNPDIELTENPFGAILDTLSDHRVGMAAPVVIGPGGLPEDSMRRFITPISLAKRVLGLDSGAYTYGYGADDSTPDWVAGMFMLFRSEAYAKVGGFDERYFMYCEDADICTRIWKAGYKVVGCLSAKVIHNAQRASHRSFRHLYWHVCSMTRYFLGHSFSLPKKSS